MTEGRTQIPRRHLKVVGDPPTADAAQSETTTSPPAQVEHPTTGDVDQHTPAAGPLSPPAAGVPGTEDPLSKNTRLVLDAIDEAFAAARRSA